LFYTQDLLALYGDSHKYLLADSWEDGDKRYKLSYNADHVNELISYDFNEDRSWWECLLGMDEGSVVEHEYGPIEVINNPASIVQKYADNLDGLSDDYLIGKDDTEKFLSYCAAADGAVVLLRFEQTDYSCRNLYAEIGHNSLDINLFDKNALPNDLPEGEKAWLCQMTWYDKVDVTRVTFQRGNHFIVYDVNAEPIAVGGGVGVKDQETPITIVDKVQAAKDKGQEWWEKVLAAIEEFIETVKFFLLVVVGIFLAWLLFKIFRLLFAPIKAVGSISDKVQRRRHEKELKRLKKDVRDRDKLE